MSNYGVLIALSSISSLLLSVITSQAYACTVAYVHPSEKLESADTVFSGTAKDIRSAIVEGLPDQHAVFFEVDRYWKVPAEKDYNQLIVFTATSGGLCGYSFEESREYLVYARYSDRHEGALHTGIGGVMAIETAQEDLAVLGAGMVPTTQLGWDEQMDRIAFQLQPPMPAQGGISSLLLAIGIGAAAGTAAFFTIRNKRNPHN